MFEVRYREEERSGRQDCHPEARTSAVMGKTAVCHGSHGDQRGRRRAVDKGKLLSVLAACLSAHDSCDEQFLEIWSEDGVAAEPEDEMILA